MVDLLGNNQTSSSRLRLKLPRRPEAKRPKGKTHMATGAGQPERKRNTLILLRRSQNPREGKVLLGERETGMLLAISFKHPGDESCP
jgi:hypothetical protein